MSELRILSTIVENKPGVLFQVSNMIRRRGYNIESIAVGTLNGKDVSKMVILVKTDDPGAQQLAKQLRKIIEVIEVSILKPEEVVMRELALIQVSANGPKVQKCLDYGNCRVIKSSPDTTTIEVVGTPEEIDSFIKLAEQIGLKDVSRTGMTALSIVEVVHRV